MFITGTITRRTTAAVIWQFDPGRAIGRGTERCWHRGMCVECRVAPFVGARRGDRACACACETIEVIEALVLRPKSLALLRFIAMFVTIEAVPLRL